MTRLQSIVTSLAIILTPALSSGQLFNVRIEGFIAGSYETISPIAFDQAQQAFLDELEFGQSFSFQFTYNAGATPDAAVPQSPRNASFSMGVDFVGGQVGSMTAFDGFDFQIRTSTIKPQNAPEVSAIIFDLRKQLSPEAMIGVQFYGILDPAASLFAGFPQALPQDGFTTDNFQVLSAAFYADKASPDGSGPSRRFEFGGQTLKARPLQSPAVLNFSAVRADLTPIPEPSTYGLAGAVAVGLLILFSRRRL
ncbi:MAG: PEP-CTERM sorting domain-containing protein [Nibricoccus sp.]